MNDLPTPPAARSHICPMCLTWPPVRMRCPMHSRRRRRNRLYRARRREGRCSAAVPAAVVASRRHCKPKYSNLHVRTLMYVKSLAVALFCVKPLSS